MTMSQQNAAQIAQAQAHAALHAEPLGVMADMPGSWLAFGREGLPFDKGVQPLLDAHARDGGGIDDIDVADLRQWPVGASEDGASLVLGDLAARRAYKLRRTAWSGLAARLSLGEGASDLLLKRLPPQIQLANLNAMLRRAPEKIPATLRIRNGEVLAVVSDRYAPIDTPDMVSMVRSALKADGLLEAATVSAVGWGGRDLVRVTFPSMTKDIGAARKVGDMVARGIDFRNGSWGGSAVSVLTNTMRLVCLNGMTRNEPGTAWHFRHVGTREKIEGKVREAIPAAVRESGEMVDRFEMALGLEINNLAALFAPLRDVLQVSEQDMLRTHLKREMAVPLLEPKAAIPLFDAINAMTAMAQELGNERRVMVESAAGELLYNRTRAA